MFVSEISVDGAWWQEHFSDEEGNKTVLIDAGVPYSIFVWYLSDDMADAVQCDLLNWYAL